MPYPTKIATCCFCGSKTALTLSKGRHELACASCGAPLHDLKRVPLMQPARPAVSHQPSRAAPAKAKVVQPVERQRRKKSKPKRRKSWMKSLAEEAFDFIEDIFD